KIGNCPALLSVKIGNYSALSCTLLVSTKVPNYGEIKGHPKLPPHSGSFRMSLFEALSPRLLRFSASRSTAKLQDFLLKLSPEPANFGWSRSWRAADAWFMFRIGAGKMCANSVVHRVATVIAVVFSACACQAATIIKLDLGGVGPDLTFSGGS